MGAKSKYLSLACGNEDSSKMRIVGFDPYTDIIGREFSKWTYKELRKKYMFDETMMAALANYTDEQWELLHLLEVLNEPIRHT